MIFVPQNRSLTLNNQLFLPPPLCFVAVDQQLISNIVREVSNGPLLAIATFYFTPPRIQASASMSCRDNDAVLQLASHGGPKTYMGRGLELFGRRSQVSPESDQDL